MVTKQSQSSETLQSLLKEQQTYGNTFIRLAEHASTLPLTDLQRRVILNQGDKLRFLGLQLKARLDGQLYLEATHLVGSTRFVRGTEFVIIQVQPGMGPINFLRMLDYTFGLGKFDDQPTQVSVKQADPAGLFLDFFASYVLRFLHRTRYRSYRFAVSVSPSRVKGRPLVREYVTRFLPDGMPYVLPCRYLDFTPDVQENQVIAAAVYQAIQLAVLLPSHEQQQDLLRKLRQCLHLLPGVTIRRVTAAEVRELRYNRMTSHFQGVHLLCATLLDGQTVTLEPSEKIPFASFAINMADLFQAYVAALFACAFGPAFRGYESQPSFMVADTKSIELDGLLSYCGQLIVIECKYKNVAPERAASLSPVLKASALREKIEPNDLYQAVAYASHVELQAQLGFLVYPLEAEPGAPPTLVGKPIDELGWHKGTKSGTPIYPLGISLSARFQDVAASLRTSLDQAVGVG